MIVTQHQFQQTRRTDIYAPDGVSNKGCLISGEKRVGLCQKSVSSFHNQITTLKNKMHGSGSPKREITQTYTQQRYQASSLRPGVPSSSEYQFNAQRFLSNSRVGYPSLPEEYPKVRPLRQTLGYTKPNEFDIWPSQGQKFPLRKPTANDFRSELEIGATLKAPKYRSIYSTVTEPYQNASFEKSYGYQRTVEYEPIKESRSTRNLGEKKYELLEQKLEENNRMMQKLKKIVEANNQPFFRKVSDDYQTKNQEAQANFKKKKNAENFVNSYITPKADKNVSSPKQEPKFSSLTGVKVAVKGEDFGYNSAIASLRRSEPLSNSYWKKTLKISIHDFQIGNSLGEGKFGKVYKAFHRQTSSIYAVKKIPKNLITSNFMIPQLALELRLQSCLNHKNILQMHGFFHDSTEVYIVLEYMQGGTLYSRLKKATKLKENEAAEVVQQITLAVEYLHDLGIAHRDIKPENIVISSNIYKLCDFGWATFCDERRKTYCGTFDYAAPEILQGVEYDMSVDLWCLGILTYELLTGKAPFYHISRKQTMKRIMNVENSNISYPSYLSNDAVDFIEQLIRKNPNDRLKASRALLHPFLRQVERI